jgi:competence protein ComEC
MTGRTPAVIVVLLAALVAGCARPDPSPRPATPTSAPAAVAGRPLTYVQIDVGQGDSSLLVTPDGHSMLVDGGPPGRAEAIGKALQAHQVDRLDVVVASHPHNDHIGSLDDIVREVPVERVLDSGFNYGSDAQKRLLLAVKERQVRFELARTGQSFSLGEHVTVSVLAPREPLITKSESDPNNNSVVLKVTYGGIRLLLTGDMEEKERERLYGDDADLTAEVYKVSHHGSHDGTDDDLLRRVQPRVALISCERGNDYGHPHREAIQALTSAGAQIYRTDLQGTLTLTSDGRTWQVATARGATADVRRAGRELAGEGPSGRGPGSQTHVAAKPDRGTVIGNRRSKVYHVGGGGRLPSPENRVLFKTEEEARRAGYRPVGAGAR